MGYSLSVCCKSPKARDRLATFLRSTMRPFSEVCGERADVRDAFDAWHAERGSKDGRLMFPLLSGPMGDWDPTQWVHVGHELAYGSGANKVGFNFTTQGDYGIFMYAVLKWAALHSGRKRGLKALSVVGMAHQSVPYITYDSEADPVLLESMIMDWSESAQAEARLRWVVDPLGTRPIEEFTHYVDRRYGPNADLGVRRPFLKAMHQRDKALQTITRGEMRRLDVLWDDFIDREER